MAEERLNKLEEKLKHLLNDLEGDIGNDDWTALDEKLNKRDATGSDAGLSALLSGLTGEVEEADWAAVADKLDNHDAAKKRKRAAYVGFSAAVLAGLIALVLVNPFNNAVNDAEIAPTKSNQTEKNSTTEKSDKLPLSDNNNTTAETIDRAGDNEQAVDDNNTSANESNNINNINISSRRNNTTNADGDNSTPSENNDADNSSVTDNNNQADKTDNNVADNTTNKNDNTEGTEKKEETENTDDTDKTTDVATTTDPEKEDKTKPALNSENAPKPEAKKEKKELAHNPLRNKITLGLFISPEYVISSFKTNPGEESWKVNKNYENLNNDQRSSAMGFSTGFDFNYNPFKNFRVQAGVKYSETRENAEYDFEVNEVIIIDNVGKQVYYYELPPGDEYQVKEAAVNKISYIEVPFMFGYNFNLGNSRWSIAPSVGGSYSKMLSASGIQLNETDLTVEEINYDELNKTNWTIQTSVGVYYQITNRLSFGVIPTYKTYLQTIETGNNYLKNRPYTIGINTGIRFSVF